MKIKSIFSFLPTLLITLILLTACASPNLTVQPAATLTSAPTSEPVPTETSRPTPLPVAFVWKLAGAPNPFSAPVGIALDPEGNFYVMDTKNSRVQKYDRDGHFLLMWGSPGSGEGQFSITLPDEGRLAVDSQGNVYVLDVSNCRVQKFDSKGTFLTAWGTKGNGDGQFLEPSDIAINKQDDIYVIDYQARTVQEFDNNGKFILRWGSSEKTPFAGLFSIAIDPDGNVLVSDEAGRIQKFDGDGNYLSTVPLKSLNNTAIDTWNIAVDNQGNIYVADYSSFRIVVLNSQGDVIATWRGGETGAAMFDSLEDITVDESGNVYITDSASNLVQKFRPNSP